MRLFIPSFYPVHIYSLRSSLLTFRIGAPIASDSEIAEIAKKHNVPPANILISYHVSREVVPLVKSTSSSRLKSNLQVVNLDYDDLKTLNGLSNRPGKAMRYNTPLWGWDLGFSDWYEQSKD